VARRVDEEETTVHAGIRDESITLSGQLLSEVLRVLVFDLRDVA
jgi:hypothetical protein